MFGFNACMMSSGPQPGQQAYTAPGTYYLEILAGVTLIAGVAIGGGANQHITSPNTYGGGAGALSYSNSISVTPGETLTIVVGSAGTNGGDSWIERADGTVLLLAKGGHGSTGGSSGSGTGDVKYSGGSAGANAGGGSAGNYTGNGANGGSKYSGGGGANLVGGYNPADGTSNAQLYGGGGGSNGAKQGAVRIMWGTGRSYPNNAGDV
jgi:hypothetical protein